jgi:hypothetical protein
MFLKKEWFALAETYKVPVAVALDGLHKTKTIKEKGKTKVIPKKPKRPSKRIEVLFDAEKSILKSMEVPFDEYSEYVKSLGKEIQVSMVKRARQNVGELIHKMWLCVEKTSAVITKRRTAFLAPLSEQERKKINFNKAFVEKQIAEFRKRPDEYMESILSLSPKALFSKIVDPNQQGELAKIQLSYLTVVHPPDTKLPDAMITAFEEYCRAFGMRKIDAPHTKTKNRPQKVKFFEDEDQFGPEEGEIPEPVPIQDDE